MERISYSMDLIALSITFMLWFILCAFFTRHLMRNRDNVKNIFRNRKTIIYLFAGSIVFPIISKLSFNICDGLFLNTCMGDESWSAFERSVSQGFGVFAGLLWYGAFIILTLVFLIGLINPQYVKFEKRINIFVFSFLILFYSGFMVLVFLTTTNFALSGHVYTYC